MLIIKLILQRNSLLGCGINRYSWRQGMKKMLMMHGKRRADRRILSIKMGRGQAKRDYFF